MRSWPALLLAPLIALGELSLAYSLVTPSCAHQSRGGLHAVALVALLAVLAMTAMAWLDWRRHLGQEPRATAGSPAVTRSDAGTTEHRPHFIAVMAVVVGALSALVCATMWLPIWILSPCW
jgi:hypothetical protein